MLVLVVGPSGAGKDTLLDIARTVLMDDPGIRFVRRTVTRPAGAGGEAHDALSAEAFAAKRDAGAFALHWEAHGLSYGLPADIAADIADGRIVVANVSRAVIAQAAGMFPLRVIEITAPPEVLAERLAGRGRESPADIARRLARSAALPPDIRVETIVNDATPQEAATRLIGSLIRAARSARRS